MSDEYMSAVKFLADTLIYVEQGRIWKEVSSRPQLGLRLHHYYSNRMSLLDAGYRFRLPFADARQASGSIAEHSTFRADFQAVRQGEPDFEIGVSLCKRVP